MNVQRVNGWMTHKMSLALNFSLSYKPADPELAGHVQLVPQNPQTELIPAPLLLLYYLSSHHQTLDHHSLHLFIPYITDSYWIISQMFFKCVPTSPVP